MGVARELLETLHETLRSPLGRTSGGLSLFAALTWLVARLREYPAGYLFPPDPEIWTVQLATWAGLVGGAGLIAAGLVLPALFVASVNGGAEANAATQAGPPRWRTWALVFGLTVMGAFLRLAYFERVPAAPWIDGVFAVHAATEAGRFLLPHEALPLIPPEVSASRVVLRGLYLDSVRVLLALAKDRRLALFLMSALPSILLVPAVFALARRLFGERAAFGAAFLVAVSTWALILGRWGWIQQAMSLLLVLALERMLAGLSGKGSGAFLAGGLIAGLACHTYIAAYLAALVLFAWLAAISLGRRDPRPAIFAGAGILVGVLPIGLFYLSHPEFLGGRLLEAGPRGGIGKVLSDVLWNTFDYSAMLFFMGDPYSRHGLPLVPHFSAPVIALVVTGLGVAFARRWKQATGLWLLLAATLLGGILSARVPGTPNGFRTGFAGVLILAPAGLGLASLAASCRPRPLLRAAGFPAVCALIAGLEIGRFADWAFPVLDRPPFGDWAAAAGRFANQIGPGRVKIDLTALHADWATWHLIAFQIEPDRALEPLRNPFQDSGPRDWRITVEESQATSGSKNRVLLELDALPTGQRLVAVNERVRRISESP